MGKQLSFKLPEIDREKTKEAVESALAKYQLYVLTIPEEKLPKVTSSFSIVPPTYTNEFHSTTEQAVIEKVDNEKERSEYIKRINKAVNRLGYKERAILIRRYMSAEDVFDYEVYNDMNMSERTYHRIKSRAFYKLAFALRIEVYKHNLSCFTK
ncbi:ArpU family transcriptional regulator [Heyndrickxia sporothermodurans]|nr:ArpU family transcriptional regulator [Heyndrickxia sporothermodurans]